MGHFEEDISTKPPLYVSTTGAFAFIKITKPIFPDKNPETKIQSRFSKNRNGTWVLSQFLLQF